MASTMQTVVSGPTWSPTLTERRRVGAGRRVERADHRALDQRPGRLVLGRRRLRPAWRWRGRVRRRPVPGRRRRRSTGSPPLRRRIRCSPCRRSISARSCSFISSTSRRIRRRRRYRPDVDWDPPLFASPQIVFAGRFEPTALNVIRRSRPCNIGSAVRYPTGVFPLLGHAWSAPRARPGDQHVVLDPHAAPSLAGRCPARPSPPCPARASRRSWPPAAAPRGSPGRCRAPGRARSACRSRPWR